MQQALCWGAHARPLKGEACCTGKLTGNSSTLTCSPTADGTLWCPCTGGPPYHQPQVCVQGMWGQQHVQQAVWVGLSYAWEVPLAL
jgi:hypothetical protein